MPHLTVHTLPNGLTVAIVHMPGARAAHLTFALQAGPLFERPEANGVTHLFEDGLFLGCAPYPSPAAHVAAFEALGDMPDVSMDIGEITIDITTAREALPEALCLLGRTVASPSFEGVDQVIHARRLEAEQEFEVSADERTTSPITALYEHVFAGHPAARPVYGTPRTLAKMTPARVKEEHARMFTGSNAVLTIAGDLDGAGVHLDDLLLMVASCFDLPRGRRAEVPPFVPPRRERPALTFMGDDAEQTIVAFGLRAPAWRERLGPAARLLIPTLGDGVQSRMVRQLIEPGICLDQAAEFGGSAHEPLASFLLVADTAKAGAAVRTFLGLLRRVATDGVYPDELARVKQRLLRTAEMELDHPRGHAMYYGLDLLREPAEHLSPEAHVARTNEVTTVDVQAVAQTMFAPGNMVVVVDGASTRARGQITEEVTMFAKPRVAS